MKIVEWVHVEGIHREICSNRYFGVVCTSASDVLFWTYGCFFELLFFFFFFFLRIRCHRNRHNKNDWRSNTVENIVYRPVKNLKKKKKRGEGSWEDTISKRTRGKAVSKTKMVPLNLKCDSNWKRYVTLRTICIEWFRLPAENTETGHAIFKTRSFS